MGSVMGMVAGGGGCGVEKGEVSGVHALGVKWGGQGRGRGQGRPSLRQGSWAWEQSGGRRRMVMGWWWGAGDSGVGGIGGMGMK